MPWSNQQFYSSGNPAFTNPFAAGNDTHGPFGTNLSPIPIPDPHADLMARIPTLDDETRQLFSNIGAQQRGRLSPETQAAIQDASAQFGVSSGMPGSGLQRNRTARDLGLATEAIQQRGLENFLKATQNVQQTQLLDPAQQFSDKLQNEINLRAPNPTQAAITSMDLFNKYLANLRGPGGGTGGRSPFNFTSGTSSGGFTPPSGASGFPAPPAVTGGSMVMPPGPYDNPFAYISGGGNQDAGQPENWSLFSPQQQWDYPDQLEWAQQFGNMYE